MKIAKYAFTLIEVLIAIIVISIAISAVPFVMKQTQKSTDFSIAQESLLASTTKIYSIYSYRWDENSSDDPENPYYVKVINTNGDNELSNNANSGFRIGHIQQNGRNKFFTSTEHNATPVANFGSGSEVDTIIDDIDDFNGKSYTITTTGGSSVDYKRDLNMNIRVIYIDDNATYSDSNMTFNFSTNSISNTTNIKMIEINSTATIIDKSISFILRGFVSNLGESSLYYRSK